MGIRSQGDPSQSYDDVFADTGKGGSGAASGGGVPSLLLHGRGRRR